MTALYLDIETCPADALPGGSIPSRAWEAVPAEGAPPVRGEVSRALRDPVKIAARTEELEVAYRVARAAWDADYPARHAAREAAALAWWAGEALDPIGRAPHLGGRVLCAAWAVDECNVELADGDEGGTLECLERAVVDAGRSVELIGHNIRGFDAPFIAARCLVLGVAPRLCAALRPADRWGPGRHIIDTLDLLPLVSYQRRPSGTGKLTDWARALGLSSAHQTGSGADVLPWYLAGRLDEIRSHCLADVAEVRALHQRLTGRRS